MNIALRMVIRVLRDIAFFIAANIAIITLFGMLIYAMVKYDQLAAFAGWIVAVLAAIVLAIILLLIYIFGVYDDVRRHR